MKNAVLDKNYLQGTSRAIILDVLQNYRLLMSDSLFYELLTTDEKARRSCFSKLVGIENPVLIVPRGQLLVQEELRSLSRARLPSENAEQVRFKFNFGLLEPEFSLPLEQSQALLEEIEFVDSRVNDMTARARSVVVLYPELFQGRDSERGKLRDRIEQEICSSTGLSEQVCELFGLDRERIEINSDWAVYRYLQTQLLMAIDIAVRNHKQLEDPIHPTIRLGIEHDLHDADFLMLGALEGCAATRETKLQKMLRLMRPEIEILV